MCIRDSTTTSRHTHSCTTQNTLPPLHDTRTTARHKTHYHYFMTHAQQHDRNTLPPLHDTHTTARHKHITTTSWHTHNCTTQTHYHHFITHAQLHDTNTLPLLHDTRTAARHKHITTTSWHTHSCMTQNTLKLWVNAQRDGCPAKYRWRPLFNPHKVWLTPTTRVPCTNTTKTRNPLKFAGVPQTRQQISAASTSKFAIL